VAGAFRGLLKQKTMTTAITASTANPPTTPPTIGPALDGEPWDAVLEVEDVPVVVGEGVTVTVEIEATGVTGVIASGGTNTLGG